MAFKPRTNSYGIYGDRKWYSENPYYPYVQMPNCTAYAYGRFWEICGTKPVGLPNANAGDWFSLANGYTKSQVPALGAVIVWAPSGSDGLKGHVAIVEDIEVINGEYFLTISESGWLDDTTLTKMTGVYCNRNNGILPQIVSDTSIVNWYWKNDNSGYPRIRSGNNYHLDRRPTYRFQGFIYPPNTNGFVPPTNWEHVETWNYNALTQEQKENNAMMIYLYWKSKGFFCY